ncbi:MAG: hypothetical protein Q9220_004442, partial [cf. Caloplaca sp. 1 TL-2023]
MGFRCAAGNPDCSTYKLGQGCGTFRADSDIAGIGVLIALVSTSLVNLTIGVIGHVLSILRGYENNAIDSWVSRRFRSLWILRISDERKDFWGPIFEKFILLLSDYQLLFGIAILVAGLWKHCSISAYHFSLVVDLAWFSNTHMTSLAILKCHLRERPTIRNWRVCIMVCMGSLTIVTFVLASVENWGPNLSCPAQCLFDEPKRDLSLTYPYIIALFLHYGTSIWRVFDTPRFDRYFLQHPRDKLQKIIRSGKRTNSNASSITNRRLDKLKVEGATTLVYRWILAFAIQFYLAIAAILGSLTITLWYDIVWFALGLTTILFTRQIPGKNLDGNENELSFGQIIPVLLLASIILTFVEIYT